MKLPFDLGVKLFFRLLLPGFFLALGFFPVILPLLSATGLEGQAEVAFVLATVVAGWGLVAADMPIYMLLEGRRYWPGWLRRWLLGRQSARLKRLTGTIEEYYGISTPDGEDRRRWIEASVERRMYPLESGGDREARFPTRLGNAIAAFEEYAETRYGVEAIFYWPRIWVNLGKDLREEVDGQQAMADSATYSAFALAVTGVLWVLFAALSALQGPVGTLLLRWHILRQPFGPGIFQHLPQASVSVLVAAVFLVLSRYVYRLAVFANEQFGVLFMAVIDVHAGKVADYLDVDGIAKRVTDLAKVYAEPGERLEVARRYLQYFNARLPGLPRPVPIPKIEKALEAKPVDVALPTHPAGRESATPPDRKTPP